MTTKSHSFPNQHICAEVADPLEEADVERHDEVVGDDSAHSEHLDAGSETATDDEPSDEIYDGDTVPEPKVCMFVNIYSPR